MAKSKTSTDRLKQLSDDLANATPNTAAWDRINKSIESINKNIAKSLANIDDFESSVKSLGALVGKSNKSFETMNLLSDNMKDSMTSISKISKTLPATAGKYKDQLNETTTSYKSMGVVIANNIKKLKKQQISQSQYNESILSSYEDLEEAIDRLDGQMEGLTGKSLKSAQAIKRTFETQKEVLDTAAKAAEKSKNSLEGVDFAINTITSSGIPGISELGNVITKAAEGGKGLALAMAAVGAAIGAMVYDLGFAGKKIQTIAKYDKQLIGVKSEIAQIENNITGLFAAERAGKDFGFQIARMAAEFEAASKTALFGNGLGSLNYGKGQLQLAGISAETIATAMKDVSSVMGSNVSAQFGADIAILAARTGQSSQNIGSINETFMRLSGVSKETAINMQEGMRAMAAQANINLGALMEDVAEASKDALSYQIKSGPALQKAAAFANSIGVKFTDIANAGRSMVLNYKDSIKAEMSLSAMLGRRVDLSQVRALFAAGDTEGAIQALKAQGLDPSKMNMFQQEALKNATGGAGLNELQKIFNNGGKQVDSKLGDAGKSNKSFLKKTEGAQASLAAANAIIDVKSASMNIAMDEKTNKAIQDELMKGGRLTELANMEARIELLKTAETGLMKAIFMLTGAIALGGASSLLSKGGGGFMNMFKGTAASSTASSVANSAVNGGSKLTKFAKGAGGKVLGVAGAGFDAYNRLQSGQSIGQTAAGVGGGAAGAYGGAALGTAILPGIGTLIGGAIGYFAGSSLIDAITGANEPTVKAQEKIETQLTNEQVKQAVTDGQLLSDSSYTIELQKEMVAQLGLSTTLLYEIADYNARGLFQSVNIDGKKVMEALASTSRKQFGVARNIMPTTTTK